MLSSLSLVIDSSRWWLVKISLKRKKFYYRRASEKARVSLAAVTPESASDNHYYIPLPLIPASPHPQPSHLLIDVACPVELLNASSPRGWTPGFHSLIRMSLLQLPLYGYYRSWEHLEMPWWNSWHTSPCFSYAVATLASHWLGLISLASVKTCLPNILLV